MEELAYPYYCPAGMFPDGDPEGRQCRAIMKDLGQNVTCVSRSFNACLGN